MLNISSYEGKQRIIQDIWIMRYPELIQYNVFNLNIIDMFYVDMVWDCIDSNDISLGLSMLNIKPVVKPVISYDHWKHNIDRFSIYIGRLERTYDKLYYILHSHVPSLYDEDEEDHEMFIHGLIEYGYSTYKDILSHEDPYDTITDDMLNARSDGLVIGDQEYNGHRIDDIDEHIISKAKQLDNEYQDRMLEDIDMSASYEDMIYDLQCADVCTDDIEDEHDEALDELKDQIRDMNPKDVLLRYLSLNIHTDDILSEMAYEIVEHMDEYHTHEIRMLTNELRK